jgi:murein DD-endopeptidase MepM/ murein hydrolase activator NlpD
MISLNNIQIAYIQNDLKSRKTSSGYRQELHDHVCCMVEEKLSLGMNFSEAYASALVEFSEQGFIELKTQSPMVKKKRRVITSQLAAASIAATVFMFVTGAGAQEPPEISPLDAYTITSAFGTRVSPRTQKNEHHRGVDFKCKIGTPVKSTAAGVVVLVKEADGGYGKRIEIRHDENHMTRYAHLSEIKVNEGDEVTLGQIIGLSGNSGWSTAPHLHYEVIKNGAPVNPQDYFATAK